MSQLKVYSGILLAFVLLVFTSCSDDSAPTKTKNVGDVQLTGVLNGQRCETIRRFHEQSGESAKITYVKDDGNRHTLLTDSLSEFELSLNSGNYLAIVESGFTWPPDTFYNIQLAPGDTSLSLTVYCDVLDPLHLFFTFWYDSEEERLSRETEVDAIIRAGRLVGGYPAGPLDIDYNLPVDTFFHHSFCIFGDPPGCWVTYEVPIVREYGWHREGWNVIEAWMEIQAAMIADSNRTLPPEMYISAGHYVCLWGSTRLSPPHGLNPAAWQAWQDEMARPQSR